MLASEAVCVPAARLWCSSELPVGPVWWTSCYPFPRRVGLRACVYVDHKSTRGTCASVTKEDCSSTEVLDQRWKILCFRYRKKMGGKVENGWKKGPHNTSSLTRKINESYAHVPVWAQVLLILQTVWVCVFENKWPHRWRGQTFQHLPEAEHAAFPFSIIASFGPASSPPVPLLSPPPPYLPLSDVWTCIFLFLPLLTSHWPPPYPSLYRIVAGSLPLLLPVKAAAMTYNPCSSWITIACSYLFFSSLFFLSFPFNVPLSFHVSLLSSITHFTLFP